MWLFSDVLQNKTNVRLYRCDVFLPWTYYHNWQEHIIEEKEWTITRHHALKSWYLPKIDIIIPHLDIEWNRQEWLNKLLHSIKNCNYPQDNINILVIEWDETVPVKIDKWYKSTENEYICFLWSDCIIEENTLKIAIMESITYNKWLVAFNEWIEDIENRCTHFIIKRDLISKIWWVIFDLRLNHVWVDNLLYLRASKINEFHYSYKATIQHNHFSKWNYFDLVYKKGWENVENDRKILNQIIIDEKLK